MITLTESQVRFLFRLEYGPVLCRYIRRTAAIDRALELGLVRLANGNHYELTATGRVLGAAMRLLQERSDRKRST